MFLKKLFLGLSALGLADALYLTFEHYSQSALVCLIGQGCNEVLSSHYAQFFGIPLGLIGAAYYFSVFVLMLILLIKKKQEIIYLLLPLTLIGFLMSGYFVYLQLFVIKSICYYCMFSAADSTVLFGLSLLLIKYFKK